DWLIPELQKIDGISCQMPNGAFYAFIDVRNIMKEHGFKTSADVASYLIDKTHVVTTDGAGFGVDGFLRISYATSLENLQIAVSKMKSAFK
ncbi:MAG: aminotransferase class I/II-fold pyridoxal phosphate-dependent enzyme, partial [Acidobacteria bacterium]